MAAVSGTPLFTDLECFTFNPFGREVLICSICSSAMFSEMLFLHLGKENSDVKLGWLADRDGLGISGLAQPGENR